MKKEATFKNILAFIEKYCKNYGSSPTATEIANKVGVSVATATRYLKEMAEEGLISYDSSRKIVPGDGNRKKGLRSIPVVGAVTCGPLTFAETDIDEYVDLPESALKNGEYFLLRAKGFSMVNAGITDGDLVLIRRQNYADSGQIVVALVDDDTTLKRLRIDSQNNRIILHPENDEMEDIVVDSCIIQGVAERVIRNLI